MNKDKMIKGVRELRFGHTDFIDWAERNKAGITPESLGLTDEDFLDPQYQYQLGDEEMNLDINNVDLNFKTINLYKYVSDVYGKSNISSKSRDFCKRMVELTKFGKKLLTFNEIVAFNSSNPGFGKGGSNSYSVFNYRGGNFCKHYWLKWKFDTVDGNLVKAPDQQGWKPID